MKSIRNMTVTRKITSQRIDMNREFT